MQGRAAGEPVNVRGEQGAAKTRVSYIPSRITHSFSHKNILPRPDTAEISAVRGRGRQFWAKLRFLAAPRRGILERGGEGCV